MKSTRVNYKSFILLMITGIIAFYLWHSNLWHYYNLASIKDWVLSFGKLGFLAFILLQVIQVVVFFIPGEIAQTTGGYLYGAAFGTVLSVLGILLGSIITFMVARIYGNSLLERVLPQKDYKKVNALINRPKNKLIIFILYLIPGFPKDVLGYVSGITPIRLSQFIVFSMIARMPGIIATTYIGSSLYKQDYKVVITISMVMIVLLGIGTLKGEKVIEYFNGLLNHSRGR